MAKFKLPRKRARVMITLWGLIGLLGGFIAIDAMLLLAGLGPHLPQWLPLAGSGKGMQFFGFTVGVSLGCLSLWGMYSQTVHAREPF